MTTRLVGKKKSLTPRVKLGKSRQIVIPKKFYTELDLAPGDYLEVELSKTKQLVITPKVLVDRHPEIDRRLAEAEEDIRAGRTSGPFDTVEKAIKHLKSVKI